MNCLNVSIQAPGRGRNRSDPGNSDSTRYGVASPRPIRVNITSETAGGRVIEALSAVTRNGAEHGVATTVASTPVKNEPAKPDLACSCAPAPTADSPTSNSPLRLSANASITTASTKTTPGSCSWNPQPTCFPPARSASIRPASTQNDVSTPSAKTNPCSLTLRRSAPA